MTDHILRAAVSTALSKDLGTTFSATDADVITVASALRARINGMPALPGSALTVLVHCLNLGAVLAHGRVFTALSPSQRQQWFSAWQGSKVGVFRQTAVFINKMSAFLYFSLCPSKN